MSGRARSTRSGLARMPLRRLSRKDIAWALPHTGLMLLLDSAEEVARDTLRCLSRSHADPGNPLREDGVLPVLAGVEYAGQAIALHAWLRKDDNGGADATTPRRAFMAGLSELRWTSDRLDDAPGPIIVTVRAGTFLEDGARYDFSITDADGLLRIQGQSLVAFETA